MTTHMPVIPENAEAAEATSPLEPGLSLVRGGALHRLFVRCRLAQEPIDLPGRRAIFVVLITWLPMALLALAAGRLFGGAGVPFLEHLAVHARFLAALPLLIVAETFVHERIKPAVGGFSERGLIAPQDQPRFDRAVASAVDLRDSVALEAIVLLLAFTGGYWVWTQTSLHVRSWYREIGSTSAGVGVSEIGGLMPAGYWYIFVALPIFHFILFRWYFRLLIWYRFLWQVSRIPLRLNALHPDRAGGLGFLNASIIAFAPVLLAHTVFLSGVVADRIWHQGERLPQFKLELAGVCLVLILLVIVPLTFFVFQLESARRAAAREYGLVGMGYVNEFRDKWLARRGSAQAESPLGSADIQSLADLANSFEVVREMSVVPFNRLAVLRLGFVLILPLLPLTLTLMPLSDMFDRVVQMVL